MDKNWDFSFEAYLAKNQKQCLYYGVCDPKGTGLFLNITSH